MSVVGGVIQDGPLAGTEINVELPTKRVNELPFAVDPQGTDKIVLYQEEGNTTTQMDLNGLRDFIVTGGNPTAITPIINGADVEIPITSAMDGQSRVNVPVLAGQMFSLWQRAIGKLATNEFRILPSGGFELRPKDANGNVVEDKDPTGIPQVVHDGEFWFAHVFDWETTSNPDTGANALSSLFTGIEAITTSTELGAIHRNKLIHAAFGSAKGVITLEDIADAPANSIVTIETIVSNSFDTMIVTKNNQKIYYQNTSLTHVYLGKSEAFQALRGDDGWYLLKELPGLDNVGDINYGYKQKLNTLICRGQEVNRVDYPRLWEWVQSLGVSLVEDAVWFSSVDIAGAVDGTRKTYRPYEGCFSYGSGGVNGTTFRLPNLQEKFLRGLNNIDANDAERLFNHTGGVQADSNRKHDHDVKYVMNGTDGSLENGQTLDPSSAPIEDNNAKGTNTYAIQPDGGYESRGINVGLLPLINT